MDSQRWLDYLIQNDQASAYELLYDILHDRDCTRENGVRNIAAFAWAFNQWRKREANARRLRLTTGGN